VSAERGIVPKYEMKFPRTDEEFAAAYDQTQNKKNMLEDCCGQPKSNSARVSTLTFQNSVIKERKIGARDGVVSAKSFK
jgi:hypothetical protein